jgi:hypothetical protein
MSEYIATDLQLEIEAIGQMLAPRLFGKPYRELGFCQQYGKLKTSELFHCARAAQEIRLEAIASAKMRGMSLPLPMAEMLELAFEVMNRPDMELQKAELRKRGFLPLNQLPEQVGKPL